MGSEPRWLIGGPGEAEDTPQQAVQGTVEAQPTGQATMGKPGKYKGKTADQWLKLAEESNITGQKSFEHLCARLAETDGIWEFPALFTLTGALVPQAAYVFTRKGKWVWRIGNGPDAQWFDESKARDGFRRRKNDQAKGYYVGSVLARGYVGPSGSSWSTGYFIGQVNDSPVEIVDNGIGHTDLAIHYRDEQ